MKRYILFFVALTALASCDVRRRDRISDDVGIKEEKTERASVIVKEKAVKDSLDKLAVFLKDSTTVQLIDSVYNFGSITAGEKVNYSFRFKNTGNKPLIITEAHASCGCTVPEKPEKPIMPGETGVIKVVFNSQGKQGHQDKAIIVNSNAKPMFGDLKLMGEVK
jgi:hypothetical protein